MKLHLLGGFLGAGKTSLARALARHLQRRGERVAIVTNDQGHALVDTTLCRDTVDDVREVRGGCFCCRYDELEMALRSAAAAGATVTVAEAVGSCADLVATVVSPLGDRMAGGFSFAPLTVVVDPWRTREMASAGPNDDVAYLFRKQIEEADVVVLSRRDLDPPDVLDVIREIRREVPVVAVSSVTGEGVDEWLETTPPVFAPPLSIDYDRYAAAEAALGWFNTRVRLHAPDPFAVAPAMHRFLSALADLPVAHVKVTSLDPPGLGAALTRRHAAPQFTTRANSATARVAEWLINARVLIPPPMLADRIEAALRKAVEAVAIVLEDTECFQPARPAPTHRYAYRCGTGDDAACCAAFYDRPAVRQLLGDSLHPGGTDLTLQLARRLNLNPGDRVLDVACGTGASLEVVTDTYSVIGIGLDRGVEARARPGTLLRGDAHAIPARDGTVDAVICECALSTFADQPRAVREMHRVLRAGGRLAVSDMLVRGAVPSELRDWVHTGTCLARAMRLEEYARRLTEAGFVIRATWDATDTLRDLLRLIKRRVVGAALLASAAGGSPGFDVREARRVLGVAEDAVASSVIGYGVVIAERPA